MQKTHAQLVDDWRRAWYARNGEPQLSEREQLAAARDALAQALDLVATLQGVIEKRELVGREWSLPTTLTRIDAA